MNIPAIAAAAVQHKQSTQHACELEQMLKLVNAMQPRVILEIGSYKGWSLWAWAQAAPKGATLISVDMPYKGLPGTDYDTNEEALARYEGYTTHFIRENSMLDSTKDKVVQALAGRTIDFLFIDGGHKYATVKSDYELYSPLVDGMIGFHDIALDGKRCRVIDYWKEIKDRYVHKEFIHNTTKKNMMGIGVIFHKGGRQ